MTKAKKPSRPLSPGDAALWQSAMRDTAPLDRRARAGRPAPPPSTRVTTGAAPIAAPIGRPLEHGRAGDVDRRLLDRLRRGRMPVEATADLHGLTQVEAHRRLADFIAECYAQGRRCVIVVTGKGLGKAEPGVLKTMVPRWLNEPGLRPAILGFDYAQPRHGGAGALYVLLRRRR
jgi:DNA-nicking Smr family endonuclease